jgi:hypothetical protein
VTAGNNGKQSMFVKYALREGIQKVKCSFLTFDRDNKAFNSVAGDFNGNYKSTETMKNNHGEKEKRFQSLQKLEIKGLTVEKKRKKKRKKKERSGGW